MTDGISSDRLELVNYNLHIVNEDKDIVRVLRVNVERQCFVLYYECDENAGCSEIRKSVDLLIERFSEKFGISQYVKDNHIRAIPYNVLFTKKKYY